MAFKDPLRNLQCKVKAKEFRQNWRSDRTEYEVRQIGKRLGIKVV